MAPAIVGAFFISRVAVTVERQSPCKVNLLLNILGKRADGFHELETLFHHVPAHDTLRFERAGGGAPIQLTCDNPSLPTDSGNLVFRAAAAFLERAGIGDSVRIHLEKRVPLAAGLGGGSSNAAHTLLGLNELFGGPLSAEELLVIGAALGSDVPFFLQDKPALGYGRGERVESLEPFAALRGVYIVLAHPGFGISTAWAYKNLARFPKALNGAPGRAAKLAEALREDSLEAVAPLFYNSLEAPCLEKFPILEIYQEFFRANGAPVALMSGSGSTTFALIRGETKARALGERFAGEFGPTLWVAVAALG